MSNREIVIEVAKRLPENTPLNEIFREVEFVVGVKAAIEDSEHEEGISAEEVLELLKTWTSKSSS